MNANYEMRNFIEHYGLEETMDALNNYLEQEKADYKIKLELK